MLVTGFGPFGSIRKNPSAMLAESCGKPFRVLDVSFRAVDAFLDEPEPAFHRLLLVGVAAGAETFRIETVARNEIGATPDVEDEVWGPGPIEPALPRQLGATLWAAPELLGEDPRWVQSVNAGTYLCNYLFFRALSRLPDKRIGFLHVPPLEVMPGEEQRLRFTELLALA